MAETYQIAHFVGGPLGGRTYSILPYLDEWRVAVCSVLKFNETKNSNDIITYDILTYRKVLDTNIFILVEENGNGLSIV